MLIFKAQWGEIFSEDSFLFSCHWVFKKIHKYVWRCHLLNRDFGKGIQTRLFNRDSTIRCLGLHFSDRTVRLIEIFWKNTGRLIEPVRLIEWWEYAGLSETLQFIFDFFTGSNWPWSGFLNPQDQNQRID